MTTRIQPEYALKLQVLRTENAQVFAYPAETGIGEPDPVLAVDHNVIWAVQLCALVVRGQNPDKLSIMIVAHNLRGRVFATYNSTVPVEEIAIRLIGWRPQDRQSVIFRPPVLAAFLDVGKRQPVFRRMPDWPFCKAKTVCNNCQLCIVRNNHGKARIPFFKCRQFRYSDTLGLG